MKVYHSIWLIAHPERSKSWLLERMADGFDIHHADGDHENNDPQNLVLIETTDHAKLHSFAEGFTREKAVAAKKAKTELIETKFQEAGVVRGSYTSKKIKGKRYWYFRDVAYKERYVGPDTDEVRAIITEYNKIKQKILNH